MPVVPFSRKTTDPPRNAYGSVRLLPGQTWGIWREDDSFEEYQVIRVYLEIDKVRVQIICLEDSELIDYSEKYFRKWFHHESNFLRLRNEEFQREVKKWRRAFNIVVGQKMA